VPSFILSGAAPLNKSENRRKRRDFVGRRAPRQDGLWTAATDFIVADADL